MHYKNGREAQEGDQVIHIDSYSKKVKVGVAHNLHAQSDTCNCTVSYVNFGGVGTLAGTLKEMYHAEDALLAIDPLILAPKA